MSKKLAVIAIGGNSLIIDRLHQTVRDQYIAAHETCEHIVSMISKGWDVVISHGNGPQVGFILRRSELASHELHEIPLDVCGADTQGAIGYALQQNLYNEFRKLGINRQVTTIVTQVEVSQDDPSFQKPSKPIGSFMNDREAKTRIERDGWNMVKDSNRGWRRVVPSPYPLRIVEEETIKILLEANVVVIAVGGGGIPVTVDPSGDLKGIAAVIDKDLTSALLASNLHADLFIISTAVEKVALNFGRPDQEWLNIVSLKEMKAYLAEGIHFAAGSMEPKIEAAIHFLENYGKEVIITNPENLEKALAGQTGTHIVPD